MTDGGLAVVDPVRARLRSEEPYSVELWWPPVAGAERYVMRSRPAGCRYWEQIRVLDRSGVTLLLWGPAQEVKVRAENPRTGAVGGWSAPVVVGPGPDPALA